MKTNSKFWNRSALMLTAAFFFCAANVNAESNSVGVPVPDEAIALTETASAPPSNLQIVSLIPITYNGNVNIRCHGTNTGRATVEATGGLPPYSYSWSSGTPIMGGIMALGLSAGPVTVTVTDANGNSVSQSVVLTQNPPLQGIANVTPIACNGGVATIALDATGGTMPYNGLSWYQFTAGTYSFTIADANGCRDEVVTTITEPPALVASAVVSAPILCNGDATNVNVEASGGMSPYNGVGAYSELAGNSNYTITDANGCYAYASVSINQPPPLAAAVSATEILCRGGESEVTISGIGGVGPYYGVQTVSQMAGDYTYSITDANGCQATTAITITQPEALVATISNTPIACNGDLSAVEVLASGGTAPYAGPGTFFEEAGLHTYTVEDANGCWVDISTDVTEPSEIDLNISWSPLANLGTTDVVVTATGGTPAYIGTGLYPAGPGVHVYTVYDANGCSGTEAIIISAPIFGTQNSDVVVSEQNNELKPGITETSLVQGSFNPSSDQVQVSYELKYDSKVSIEVYDMSGALVESIDQDQASLKGESHTVSIDAAEFTSGVYLYHFVTNTERQVGKLQIVH